jgi:microcystin-dependent protein
MAHNINTLFPTQTNAPSADFPFGSARNVSSQDAVDGTPYDERLINDYQAFFQSLLQAAGEVPNDVTDTVQASQLFDSLTAILPEIPPGLILPFSGDSAPSGFLPANGAVVSRATYADLFAAIGETYGAGDGVTTFGLPDVRGYFPRFLDSGAGRDPDAAGRTARPDGVSGDNVGTTQGDENLAHAHIGGGTYTPGDAPDVEIYGTTPVGSTPDSTDTQGANGSVALFTSTEGGLESRPINIAVLGIIKY